MIDVLHSQTFLANVGEYTAAKEHMSTQPHTHEFGPHCLYIMFLFATQCALEERQDESFLQRQIYERGTVMSGLETVTVGLPQVGVCERKSE